MKKLVIGMTFILFSFSIHAYETIAVADRIKLDEAKEVIPKLVNGKQACFVSSVFKFPIEYSSHDKSRTLGKQLNIFEKIGLLKSKKKKIKSTITTHFSKKKITVIGKVYTLTDLGNKYFKKNAEQWFRNPTKPIQGPGFCYGDIEVMSVHKLAGVNHIEYYLKVNNKPDWAMTKEMENSRLLIDTSLMNFKMRGIPDGKQAQLSIRKISGEWKLHYFK